jgi:UDP-glucose 4-epimerase
MGDVMIGITGHRGVLGTLLKQRLTSEQMSASLFDGDVRNRSELLEWVSREPLDAVFHLAALVPVTHVREKPFHAYAVNVGGCIHLGEVLASLPHKPHVFYASTSHVYAGKHAPIREDDPVVPQNWYGTTKHHGEEALTAYAKETGAPVCIGRIFSFYSDLQEPPGLYPVMKQRLATEDLSKPFRLMGANSVRDMSPAEDIVEKLVELLNRRAVGVYNVGSGKGITIRAFVDSIAPQPLKYEVDESEPTTSLVADISKYNQLLEN